MSEPLEIRRQLASGEWSDRALAQKALESVANAERWRGTLTAFSGVGRAGSVIVARALGKFLETASVTDVMSLAKIALLPPSPIADEADLSRQILEISLSSPRLGYRAKVDLLVDVFDEVKELGFTPPVSRYVIRALGYMRARRAVTFFEEALVGSNEGILLETVKALRAIGDSKAAPFLEKLFASPNAAIVSASVEAYAELGLGWWRGYRLYRLYLVSDRPVREAILKALLRVPNSLGARIFELLYDRETDLDLRHQIIRSLSFLPGERTGRFLLRVASFEPKHRLRSIAGWCLGAFPSQSMQRAIRSAIRGNDPALQRWAMLKAAQLPIRAATGILRPLTLKAMRLAPVLRHSLVEAVGKLPELHWSRDWLLEQIHGDPLCSMTAAFVLLTHRESPINSVIREVRAHQRPSSTLYQLVLGCLMHDNRVRSEADVKKFVIDLHKHSSFQVRYLSASVLLQHGGKEGAALVCEAAMKESKEDRRLIAGLVASAIGNGQLSPVALPQESIRGSFSRQVFRKLKPTAWPIGQWRELLEVIKINWETQGASQRFQDSDPLWKFILRHREFWGPILNEMLRSEEDPTRLSFLSELALHEPSAIESETLKTCLARVATKGHAAQSTVLKLVSLTRREELFTPLVEWVVRMPPKGVRRRRGYRALSKWIAQMEVAA